MRFIVGNATHHPPAPPSQEMAHRYHATLPLASPRPLPVPSSFPKSRPTSPKNPARSLSTRPSASQSGPAASQSRPSPSHSNPPSPSAAPPAPQPPRQPLFLEFPPSPRQFFLPPRTPHGGRGGRRLPTPPCPAPAPSRARARICACEGYLAILASVTPKFLPRARARVWAPPALSHRPAFHPRARVRRPRPEQAPPPPPRAAPGSP